MLDTYHAGIQYLKDKLGTRETRSGLNIKNSPNKIDTTYRREKIVPYSTEHSIDLLLGQYYYGSAPKRELADLLTSLGVEHK